MSRVSTILPISGTKKERVSGQRTTQPKRLYVPASSVFKADPMCVFNFEEHDVAFLQTVARDIEQDKNSKSETASKSREAGEYITEHLVNRSVEEVGEGIEIKPHQQSSSNKAALCTGRLFIQNFGKLRKSNDYATYTNLIDEVIALQKTFPDREVVLVTKSISQHIEAKARGVCVEDYTHGKSPFYTGQLEMDEDFWSHVEIVSEDHNKQISIQTVLSDYVDLWYPGLCLHDEKSKHDFMVRSVDRENEAATLESLINYQNEVNAVYGKTALNRELSIALNHCMDPDKDFVSLTGDFGTGKTFAALQAGLEQVERGLYPGGIVFLRRTAQETDPMGFLTGDMYGKQLPWMNALKNNLQVLAPDAKNATAERGQGEGLSGIRLGIQDVEFREKLERLNIRIEALSLIDGSSWPGTYIILDEAHKLDLEQMFLLITRPADGSKLVCCANTDHMGMRNLTLKTSGIMHAVNVLKDWEHSGHILLTEAVRSRLTKYVKSVW